MRYIMVKDDVEIGEALEWNGPAMSKAVYEATDCSVSVSLPANDPQGIVTLGGISLRPVEEEETKAGLGATGMAMEEEADTEAIAEKAAEETRWRRQDMVVDVVLALLAEREKGVLSKEEQAAIDAFLNPE